MLGGNYRSTTTSYIIWLFSENMNIVIIFFLTDWLHRKDKAAGVRAATSKRGMG
jgi:hypothetical protein